MSIQKFSPRKLRGFTLFEILIVIATIGLLAVLAVPAYNDYVTRSRIKDKPQTAVDRELAKLRWESIAFVAPERLEMGTVASVQLAVGGGKSVSELGALLDAAGKRDGQRVQVANRMEATLTSSGFQITPTTPTTQVVSSTSATLWKWEIKPTEYGSPTLNLSLNALVTIDDKESTKSIKTFQRNISVEVTSARGVWAFIDAYRVYVGGVFTAVLLPVIGYFFKRQSEKKA